MRYKEYCPTQAKHVIDEIDKVLSKQYELTEVELDFIVNYDIKYRMGKELEEEESQL
jgi:predicted metal-dependent peptidase